MKASMDFDWRQLVVVGLVLMALPAPTSSFASSRTTTRTPRHPTMHHTLPSARIRRHDSSDTIDYAMPSHHRFHQLDSRITNSTTDDYDWFFRTSSSSRHHHRHHPPVIEDRNDDFFTEGFIAHQSLLNSITNRHRHHRTDHHHPDAEHHRSELFISQPSSSGGGSRGSSSSSSISTKSECNDRQDLSFTTATATPAATTSTSTISRSTLPFLPNSTTINLSDTWKARLLLLLSAALYGTNFTMVKNLDDIMPVGISSTMRFGFAAIVMFPMLLAPLSEELREVVVSTSKGEERSRSSSSSGSVRTETGRNGVSDDGSGRSEYGRIMQNMFQFLEEPSRLSAGLAGMEIGLYNSIGYIAQAVGLRTTTASKSAFICSMAVVTVPILDYIWGKQLLRRQIVGACLAAFGVFALELGGQQTTITDGDVMSLIQPLVFGLGFWKMEAAMEKYPTEAGRLAAAQLLTVFLVSLSYLMCWSPMAGGGGEDALPDVCNVIPSASEIIAWLHDPYIMGMFIWTGIITTAFTIYMETLALKTLSAAETTLIFSTEPLFGAAFAAIVAHECFGLHDAIGAVFIIAGCLVSGMDVGKFLGGSPKSLMALPPMETTLVEKSR